MIVISHVRRGSSGLSALRLSLSTRCATEMAFVPWRFATLKVTAGCSRPAGPAAAPVPKEAHTGTAPPRRPRSRHVAQIDRLGRRTHPPPRPDLIRGSSGNRRSRQRLPGCSADNPPAAYWRLACCSIATNPPGSDCAKPAAPGRAAPAPAGAAADQRRRRNVRHLLDRVVQLRREAPQRQMVVARAVQRQRQNRHIVNGRGLISGCETPGGIRSKLACIFWFSLTRLPPSSPDLEAHDDQRSRPGCEVE